MQVHGFDRGDVGRPFPPDLLEAPRQGKIEDSLAVRAVEMGVGRAFPLEARGGIAVRSDLPGQALLPEKIQVAVHGSEADVGENLARLVVDRFRGWVISLLPEDIEYDRPLPGVAGFFPNRFHDFVSY